jgi:hypothetical protein
VAAAVVGAPSSATASVTATRRARRAMSGLDPEPPDEVVDVLHGEAFRPLGGFRVGAEALRQVDRRLPLRRKQPPDVHRAAAAAAEVEHRVQRRLRLVRDALTKAVERDPGGGDAARRQDATLERVLGRERVEVAELRAVVERDAVAGQGQLRLDGIAGGVEERLRLLAQPEATGHVQVGPGLNDAAGREQRAPARDLGAAGDPVEIAQGTLTKPSISRRAVR